MITKNAEKVLERRYLWKNDNGEIIETPDQLFRRVAKHVASGYQENTVLPELFRKNELEELFYTSMINGHWLPNTPCLMNAGKQDGQLSACFVLPVEDSMEGIFDAIKWAAIIHKTGGGTGFSFSRLRPKNSPVKSTHGIASGPVSFMKVFNAATEAVKQGGSRRGANMGILRVDHPDILEFIDCKQDLTQVTNFNISVALTDEFMEATRTEEDYYLYDPKFLPEKKVIVGTLSSKLVLDRIIYNAWKTGEPGCIFIDRINEMNPGKSHETIEATNPCGEIPLPPFDVCNLLSINLGTHVDGETFNWHILEHNARIATIFLDSMINVNHFPIPQIQEQVLKSRRLGLGVMGFADALIKLGIPYDSNLALEFAQDVMSTIKKVGDETSRELGRAFGHVYDLKRRNTTITMIAPTGTISIIAGCSSGIEPIYSIAFTRNVMEGTRMTEVNPEFERVAKGRGFYSKELMEKIANSNSIQSMQEIPEDVREIFKTAADISPEAHVKMQAVFQKYCDSAVSKTINLPENASAEDVRSAYLLAYQLGCKGVTVYRDGSRPGQVLSTGATPESARNTEQVGAFGHIVNTGTFIADPERIVKIIVKSTTLPRPDRLYGYTEKIKTGYGNLYVTINSLNNKPFEVFASIGKSGFSMMADAEAICRLISLGLRNNIPMSEITEQLQGIGGSQAITGKNGTIYSIADAISKILKSYNGHEGIIKNTDFDISKEKCPDCDNDLVYGEGCVKCPDCGYSRC